MALQTVFLLLPLLLAIGARATTSNGLGMEGVHSPGRGEGRKLMQVSNTNNPVIKFEDALLRRVPEPIDWNVYTVEIRNAYQLRSAICESNGDIYLQDPITEEDRNYCYEVGDTPKKISVIVREDLYLRGMQLPPIKYNFKIDGRCDDAGDDGDTVCAIHATSALCSACSLPSEDTGTDDLELCDACKFGMFEGRETTVFRIRASAKLWMENIELAGCKTESSGGCIKVASGDRLVWRPESNSARDMTYLEAINCRFRRGYAEGEGGAVMIQTGALAFFQDSAFLLNYAKAQGQTTQGQTADKSYDVMIQNFAAAVFIDCIPTLLHVTATQVLDGFENFLEPYQVGKYFIVTMDRVIQTMNLLLDFETAQPPPASTLPSPPTGNIPSPPVIIDTPAPSDPDKDDDDKSGGGGIPIGVLIAIVAASVIAGAAVVFCCWWCCADPQQVEDEDEEGLELGPKQKSMFIRAKSYRGKARRYMSRFNSGNSRGGRTNFSTRFNSAFKSYVADAEANGETTDPNASYQIPGTNKKYTTEQLMKGRILTWTGDPDRDDSEGFLGGSIRSFGTSIKGSFKGLKTSMKGGRGT